MTKPPDSLVGEALDKELPKHSHLQPRRFEGWHKPRKQWIRRNQWLKETIALCGSLLFRDNRPLRYLSLPGLDLLDVRVIRECCDKLGLMLKYLGLNNKYSSMQPNTWLHIAWNEVNSMDHIHHDSVVIRDRFEQIANRRSLAFRYVEQYGPFDVVNLDLCESISPRNQKDSPNYYSALQSLADYQIKNRTEAWLLLVTSRVAHSKVSYADLQKLISCVTDNATRHNDFAKQLGVVAPKAVQMLRRDPFNGKTLSQSEFMKFFSVGLGKWLLSMMSTGEPKWGVKLLPSYAYRVGEHLDMVSYAFLLEPYIHGPVDSTGLANAKVPNAPVFDEKFTALELIDSVKAIEDLDNLLALKKHWMQEAQRESEQLLASARYDVNEYRKWLQQSPEQH